MNATIECAVREESIVNSASAARNRGRGQRGPTACPARWGRLRSYSCPHPGDHCQHARCPRGLEIPPSIPDVRRLCGCHNQRIACRPNSIRRRLGPCHLIATDKSREIPSDARVSE